ncbi:ABC transporter ATP-binding protein [Streptomyces avicenniae]|uniref:ABC transporter ATP-binding protein n=1 Tax=Streptomyces avicenniae TaxID=500153 RepID=UPI000699D924|nr:ABC transporter ATP-binding protein [Streptomyces avicenniae]
MTDTAISASGLWRRYGPTGDAGFDAVRGLDLEVGQGELFALLGTNGAGKTSTLEVLEGLAQATRGTVRVLGKDPYAERAAVRPRIGIMLQEGGFPSDLTAEETARMWAGCTSGARPVREALETVGLAERAHVRVGQLSGGERRRLDLALALLGRPQVLFLDEPTTGMDAEARRATWQVVRDLLGQGTTVLLTTHYLEEAEALADRLAIMHKGRIAVSGTPKSVTAQGPSHIRFRLPEDIARWQLPAALGARGVGDDVRIETYDLQGALTGLLLWARDHRVQLTGLDARTASLEEAFLAIAGDSRYDDAAAEVAAR